MCSGSSDFQAETWLNDINVKIYIYIFLSMCDQPGKNKQNEPRGECSVGVLCFRVSRLE